MLRMSRCCVNHNCCMDHNMEEWTSRSHQNALENTIITKSGGLVFVPVFLEEWASMPVSVVPMYAPTTEGIYNVVGRVDDVLVLSSGEKTVPAPTESVIGTRSLCVRQYAIDVEDEKQVAEFRNL
ncbi:hypothetical protein F5141DRAFT_1132601, partial [Pisolithus sp. B1]